MGRKRDSFIAAAWQSLLAFQGLPAFGLFLLFAVIITFPLVLHLHTHIVGYPETNDALGQIWHCWWMGEALSNWINPYQVHKVLFPAGSVDFLQKSGPCFNAACTVPFQLLGLNLVASYNLTALLILAFNGYAAFRLMLELGAERLAALLTGVLLVLNPALLTELLHTRMDQLSVGWCLLYLIFLRRTLRGEGRWSPIMAALFLFVASISYIGYIHLLFLISAYFILYDLITRRLRLHKALVWRLTLLVGLFLLLLSPLAYQFLTAGVGNLNNQATGVAFPWGTPSSPDQLSLAERIILMNSLRLDALFKGTALPGVELVLPGVALALALLGMSYKRRHTLRWLICALLFLVLAFGPYLVLHGGEGLQREQPLMPMPGLLFYNLIPLSSRFRFPVRFLFFFWIALSVLAGFGLARVMSWLKERPRLRLGAAGILLTLLVVEAGARGFGIFPYELASFPRVPRFFSEELAQAPDMAILNIPTGVSKPSIEEEERSPQRNWQMYQLYYQAMHRQRIVGGLPMAFQISEHSRRFLKHNSLLENTLRWQRDHHAVVKPVLERDLQDMARLGLTYVVVKEDWLRPENLSPIIKRLDAIFGPPRRFPEDHLVVYDVVGRGPARATARLGIISPEASNTQGQAPP